MVKDHTVADWILYMIRFLLCFDAIVIDTMVASTEFSNKRGIEPKTVQAHRGLVESLTDHLQVEVCSLQVVLQVDLHVLGLGQLQCRLVVHVLHTDSDNIFLYI
jgi:hypothetical protein